MIDTIIKVASNLTALDILTILLSLNFLDLCLGLARAFKNKSKILSNTLYSGISKNFVPSLIPYLIFTVGQITRDTLIMSWLAIFIAIILALFSLQSIVANYAVLGFKLPQKLYSLLEDEINHKLDK